MPLNWVILQGDSGIVVVVLIVVVPFFIEVLLVKVISKYLEELLKSMPVIPIANM